MALVRFHTANGVEVKPFDIPVLLGDLLGLHGHSADMPCAGQGKCGKCRVKAVGKLSALDSAELTHLSEEEIKSGIRLACRAYAVGDSDVWIDVAQKENILTDFSLPHIRLSPKEGLGLALDIGTTTLAMYIFDLCDGRLVDVSSAPNPQRAYGSDVTNRLKASIDGETKALANVIRSAISKLAGEYILQIKEAVITGNTAMLYLLTEENVSSIAYAPFEPSTRMGIQLSGDRVGLCKDTTVWLPHCVSAYVGADITCAMIYAATRPEYKNKPLLLADIGTNGEMALFTDKTVLTCSTAAGPAFEGAGIRCGMTAATGAINRVDTDGKRITYTVIGNCKPKGICGSGLVDAVAVLLELGIIDETGRMYKQGHSFENCITELDGRIAFSFPDSDVLITQEDIRSVQLAKAAICAGMLTLLDESGLDCDSINALQIAGGFGSFIRPESAAAIGLIPKALANKVYTLGNGAGAGASMMLLEDSFKSEGERISALAETVTLATSKTFADCYIDCMAIEPCE